MEFKNFVLLQEVLDNISESLPLKWRPKPSPSEFKDKYIAYFTVGDAVYYIVFSKAVTFPSKARTKKGLYGYYVLWDMHRGNEKLPDDLDMGDGIPSGGNMSLDQSTKKKKSNNWNMYQNYQRTHKGDFNIGNTLQVLRYVLSGILQFVKAMNPALISYRAADNQLSRVYKMFADKHADDLGYDFYGRHLVRKDILERWGPQIEWFLQNADNFM